VFCLNSENGESLWQYTTGGRIDSSPTLYDGLVIFGSTDGWVYCLRAADGRLVWRFRAAPDQRRIVIRSQLESAWPVHGSVIVQNGMVYCTAGRSSFLDGGIWIYALDPRTGKVLHEKRMESPEPDVMSEAGRPFDMSGVRTDLLVSDGTDLYMFFTRLSPDLQQKETPRITKLGDRKVSVHLMSNSGFLDTSWFDRNYWTYGNRWPGYYFGYDAPKSGQLLVFDGKRTYGVDVFTTRQGHSPRFWPGTDGYTLFADTNANQLVLRPTAIGREKGDGYSAMLPHLWAVKVPIRMRAMVLAGSRLYVAGPPDVVPKDDPMAAFEGRLGGWLWVVSTSNGERLAQYKLDSPPVPDGMMAAGGRLYLADRHGVLTCMGKKP
jgi:PQQ-like domain